MHCGEFLTPDQVPFDKAKHLALSDLTLDQGYPQWYIKLSINCLKTDQFGRGATEILGATRDSICPVSALLDYLALRGGSQGPLFALKDGQPLHRQYFVSHVQSVLS